MSQPAELNRILSDLASGVIDESQAAKLIENLQGRGVPVQPPLAAEALYDTPPARAAADEDEPDAEEPSGEVPEQPFADQPDEEQPLTDQSDEAQPDEARPDEEQPSTVFSIGIEDVAATAGEFVRDAGDFAKLAWQRFGQFTGGTRPAEPVPAEAEADPEEPVKPPRPSGSRGVERVVLRSVGRRVRLVGDPRVATIAADGPHTLRRQGVTLEVTTEGELGLKLDGFSVVRPPRSVEDLRQLGFGQELVVRINPAIPVDAEVTGSRLTTVSVPYLGRIRVSAGSANLSGVVEVTDALVQVGGATLSGSLSGGRSAVRVESGNLSVHLAPDADVTVHATTQMGRISWPGESNDVLTEYVVGNGNARLEMGVVMGRAVVRLDG